MNDYSLMKLAELRGHDIRRENEHERLVREARHNHPQSGNRLSRLFKGRGKDHLVIK